ncbi:hypothetical protein A0H81_10333 [Grifola frondosa]|uniref:Uncharacterized protein n=1 Tax=Grifola frondosa TaxID=5627 RepID=A0A1C7LY71_GRIFR|nr:hypothetical protein A0H81_10333 [Grifola frondosa]
MPSILSAERSIKRSSLAQPRRWSDREGGRSAQHVLRRAAQRGRRARDHDLEPAGDPLGALIRSQGWIMLAAARALIFIHVDNRT